MCRIEPGRRRRGPGSGSVVCAADVPAATPGCDGYRLPTLAEQRVFGAWALAGAPRHEQRRQAVVGIAQTAHATPAPVASREPNAHGLFDTVGNVAEWLDERPPADDRAHERYVAHTCLHTPWRKLDDAPHTHERADLRRRCIGFRVVRSIMPAVAQSP